MQHFITCYIDPGNGGYLFQMIIGAVIGGSFYIKTIWGRVRSIFVKPGKDNDDVSN